MANRKIYFAASIRGGRGDQEIYANIISLLKQYGQVLTEHFGSSDLTSQGEKLASESIRNRDKEWVGQADAIVAEVSTPSLGVGVELGWAEEQNKRTICLYREQEGKRLSALVEGSPNFQVFRYQTIDDLAQIFSSELG